MVEGISSSQGLEAEMDGVFLKKLRVFNGGLISQDILFERYQGYGLYSVGKRKPLPGVQ